MPFFQQAPDPRLHGTIVPGAGVTPCRYMIVGERPGEVEAVKRQPFQGRAGKEQDKYLGIHGMHSRQFYRTNACQDYALGNPDPTAADIARWTPVLLDEIARVQPKFIITAGRFAARWFLGPDTETDFVHGIPHQWRDGITILPCIHPAAGFYDDDVRSLIAWDYGRAVAAIRGQIPLNPAYDDLAGYEVYEDLTGRELRSALSNHVAGRGYTEIAFDTEGIPGDEWSVQVCVEPGRGYVLRRSQPDFAIGIAAIQWYVDHSSRPVVVVHNGMYDIEMVRGMGLDLFEANIFDTMYAAYLLRVEPQGLKPLSYRWTGMKMQAYTDVVGNIGLEKQLEYLMRVMDEKWPDVESRLLQENDGTSHVYKPVRIDKIAYKILDDFYADKRNKDGEPVDPLKRWKKTDKIQRRMVESSIGKMPIGTLADIPLADAVYYAGRDPDATLRTYRRMVPELARMGLSTLMQDGMDVLPIFEEMQSNGMPARRSKFEALSARMQQEMFGLQTRISHRYYNDEPFNPGSPDKVAAIIRRRGLVAEKRSKVTKKISTSKKSIEHLRYEDPAIADIIDWRERQKIKTSFCDPIVDLMEEEYQDVRCTIKITRTASRRISAADPNLTAIPVRHELGLEVRDCYECEEGYLFGGWDLSQIEMRYMAHVSKDPLLVEFFNKPWMDVHAETAARIFGLKINDVKDKEERYQNIDEMLHRYPSKRAGFGIITNIKGAGLLDQLRMFGCKGWTEDSCDDLIIEWLKVYKGVNRFLEDTIVEVQRTGMVRDCWGHIRYLPGVWSDDRRVQGEAERAASSHKIQGGAQGMLQRSMAWLKGYIRGLAQAGEDVRWLLQIHDEIILKFKENLWDTINPLIIEGLTEHSLSLIVPVKCSSNKAKTWREL